MHLPLGFLNWVLRLTEKPYLRRARNIPRLRLRFEIQAWFLSSVPPLTAFLPDQLEDSGLKIPALWVQAGVPKKSGVILYLHGGAFVMGGSSTHRAMVARLSALTGLRAIIPEYRKAPEHVFPAAINDALAAYCALLARGYRADQIVLGGDSAGGGLALALLHLICLKNLPRPSGLFAFSPWTDLTLSGSSIVTNANADPVLPADGMVRLRDKYLGDVAPHDPRASPLFGNFSGAPPVYLQVSDTEILLDDSREIIQVLKKQGVDAQLDIWQNMPHVWQFFQGHLPEADRALGDAAAFVEHVMRA